MEPQHPGNTPGSLQRNLPHAALEYPFRVLSNVTLFLWPPRREGPVNLPTVEG